MEFQEALRSLVLSKYPQIDRFLFSTDRDLRRQGWPPQYRLVMCATAYGLAFMMEWGEPESDDEPGHSFMLRPDDVLFDDWEVVEHKDHEVR